MVRPCRHHDRMCLLHVRGREKERDKIRCHSRSLTNNYSSSHWWSSGLRVWLADDVRPLPVEVENGPHPRPSEHKSIFCAEGPQVAIATDLFARFFCYNVELFAATTALTPVNFSFLFFFVSFLHSFCPIPLISPYSSIPF